MTIEPRLVFEAQGNLVKVAYVEPKLESSIGVSSRRGKITMFSRKSRKRLLEMTARLDLAKLTQSAPIIFITLTYAASFPEPMQAKAHLRALLERIRRIEPNSSGIWRMEFQERGAPHFHIIFFNLPFIDKEVLNNIWGDIIGIEYWDYSQGWPRPPFTRVEAIRNPRKAMAYVSKYVAKSEDTGGGGFNNLPYLHANGGLGRVWGVFNSKALTWAKAITMIVDATRDDINRILWQYRRLMAKRWKSANKYGRYKGASLFVDHNKQWFHAFLWCIMEYGVGYCIRI